MLIVLLGDRFSVDDAKAAHTKTAAHVIFGGWGKSNGTKSAPELRSKFIAISLPVRAGVVFFPDRHNAVMNEYVREPAKCI